MPSQIASTGRAVEMPAVLTQSAADPQGGEAGLNGTKSVFLVRSLPRLAKNEPVRGTEPDIPEHAKNVL